MDRAGVDAALHRVTERDLAPLEPVIRAPVVHALDAGGKRLRPLLCVSAFRAASPNGENVQPPGAVFEIAAAVEWIHTYSLIHDDLPCMDDDDLRRGRPTAHRVFGERAATLAAFHLIPLACQVVAKAAHALGMRDGRPMELVRTLCAGAGGSGMVGGQLLDLGAEGRAEYLSVEQLDEIHTRKTGSLIVAALRLGGQAAAGSPRQLDALTAYGRSLGLAFQITDDLLDETGEATSLGKQAGRDQALGKATFPALLGLEAARSRAAAEVELALSAVTAAGVASTGLEALARYAVERDR